MQRTNLADFALNPFAAESAAGMVASTPVGGAFIATMVAVTVGAANRGGAAEAGADASL